jgi:hypothetical protein
VRVLNSAIVGTGQAVEILFDALSACGQAALRELRDGDFDEAAIDRWAENHHLACPHVVEFVVGLLPWWKEHARAAAELRCNWRTTIVCGPDDPADSWLEKVEPFISPGADESLRSWRKRADAIYRELRSIRGHFPSRPDQQTLRRYAEWFVMRQVLGMPLPQIAASLPYNVDTSTLGKGIARFSRMAQIPVRRSTGTESNVTR